MLAHLKQRYREEERIANNKSTFASAFMLTAGKPEKLDVETLDHEEAKLVICEQSCSDQFEITKVAQQPIPVHFESIYKVSNPICCPPVSHAVTCGRDVFYEVQKTLNLSKPIFYKATKLHAEVIGSDNRRVLNANPTIVFESCSFAQTWRCANCRLPLRHLSTSGGARSADFARSKSTLMRSTHCFTSTYSPGSHCRSSAPQGRGQRLAFTRQKVHIQLRARVI